MKLTTVQYEVYSTSARSLTRWWLLFIYSEPYQVRSCDFESSAFCGWIQDTTDDFDWTRHSGKTTTGRTGPNSDHTLGPHDPTGTALNIFYIDEKTAHPYSRIISDHQNIWSTKCSNTSLPTILLPLMLLYVQHEYLLLFWFY